MKKKIFGFIAVAALAVVAGWNYQQDQLELRPSDLTLADVEALADKEVGCVNGTQNTRYCFVSNGRYKCDSYWIWNCVTEINN